VKFEIQSVGVVKKISSCGMYIDQHNVIMTHPLTSGMRNSQIIRTHLGQTSGTHVVH